ncbi:UNKNOWN [Stylonychia lemnae]|uniref:Uncharacterized protein n=1 Tax=Stylonychia lemnae TaxID=5949 RepID=A0A078AKV4_STYLE|nr:UNKNOWN [Stylonychia lemnae]|eukprot:CDW82834.1 UNKNOWN [Stylonychia lemnae]
MDSKIPFQKKTNILVKDGILIILQNNESLIELYKQRRLKRRHEKKDYCIYHQEKETKIEPEAHLKTLQSQLSRRIEMVLFSEKRSIGF